MSTTDEGLDWASISRELEAICARLIASARPLPRQGGQRGGRRRRNGAAVLTLVTNDADADVARAEIVRRAEP